VQAKRIYETADITQVIGNSKLDAFGKVDAHLTIAVMPSGVPI